MASTLSEESRDSLQIVLPGDLLPATESSFNEDSASAPIIKLGPGLQPLQDDTISAVKAGVLKHAEVGNRWWVESNQRRYVAAPGESVIGVVVGKTVEHYKVDIGAAQTALLGVLAFEGASKRNKPNHEIGTLLYCRISLANKDMEAELECMNPTTGKSDGYGDLKGGFVFKTSLGLARRLLDPKTLILRILGQHIPFETAVGMNGKVWINSANAKHTILICNAIKNSEFLSQEECVTMVKGLVDRL
ncbi:exosome complex component RRP40 [Entomortierella parvispora]|uniref:Ribosomal RNA-processing protein 40 n=1 Tax=Entomortierella parvispora TaxID=205924 RepID=A0A9P3HK21_9FUNG|nr:exosome complex component RRP40 [Entomortierella parvispora]